MASVGLTGVSRRDIRRPKRARPATTNGVVHTSADVPNLATVAGSSE